MPDKEEIERTYLQRFETCQKIAAIIENDLKDRFCIYPCKWFDCREWKT